MSRLSPATTPSVWNVEPADSNVEPPTARVSPSEPVAAVIATAFL